MESVDVLLKYWPVVAGVVALLYFVFKLSMRNAILEVFKELEDKFVMKDLYSTKISAIEDRIIKLERTRGDL